MGWGTCAVDSWMANEKLERKTRLIGFLTRLRKDARGNALALMAAMLVPLIAFSGAAIDLARIYVVKARLQQACDAGSLAGRKAMTDTTVGTPLDSTATTQAQAFFKNNFRDGWFQVSNTVFTPTKATAGSDSTVANAVNGIASTQVPMTLMSFFGAKPLTLTTSCQAIYDLADTDVMFVLDVTGSMSVSATSKSGEGGVGTYTRSDGQQAIYRQEQSDAKIEALRQAVILFDKTMTENKQTDTIVRYGFSPYSNVVSVGKLLPASSVSSNLNYNTRKQNGDYVTSSLVSAYPVPQASCSSNSRYPSSGYANNLTYIYKNGGTNKTMTVPSYGYAYFDFTGSTSWTNSNGGTCTSTGNTGTVSRPLWTYGQFPLVVTDYLAGKAVPTPGRLDGSTSLWRGCIELTDSSTATSFNANSLPSDLDPDVLPNWRPMWPEAVWNQSSASIKDENVAETKSYKALGTYENNDSVTCPMDAQTLRQMSADDVKAYVYAANFKADGNTYHDYGMSWGLRMLSTVGPFKNTVLPSTGRKQPGQNIVFMTDGAAVADSDNYQMYGIEGLDKRMTGGTANETSQHKARLRVLCDAAKARGITVYMIAFGTSLTDDMTYCASAGQAFQADNTDDLQDAFAAIAKRIAMLRMNK
jgi:Flp pilus assembly protein TadG